MVIETKQTWRRAEPAHTHSHAQAQTNKRADREIQDTKTTRYKLHFVERTN